MMMPLINILMSVYVPRWVEYVVLYVGASLVAIGAVCDLDFLISSLGCTQLR